jgi:hypothetical protein
VGHPGDLLLKSALGLVATVAGSGVLGVRYLGLMANAQTENVLGVCRTVSLRPRLVDLYPSFPRSSMATRGSVMPRATIDGDRVRITGFRDVKYRSTDDFTVRFEEREFLISHLTSVDFFVSYWKKGPVGHTFLSFNFDNALPLCISIETRPEVGEGFDPIASLFKQFELIYVVGDEHDIVGVRTNYRKEDVYLYHILTSPENARRLFLVYMDRIRQSNGDIRQIDSPLTLRRPVLRIVSGATVAR